MDGKAAIVVLELGELGVGLVVPVSRWNKNENLTNSEIRTLKRDSTTATANERKPGQRLFFSLSASSSRVHDGHTTKGPVVRLTLPLPGRRVDGIFRLIIHLGVVDDDAGEDEPDW